MTTRLESRNKRSRLVSQAFTVCCLAAALTCLLALFVLLGTVLWQGVGWLSWGFLTNLPSRFPEKAGIRTALAGSAWLIALTSLFALPTGLGAAVYLEEYAPNSRWKSLVQTNIANLAGVPSIVYGILGLGLFVQVAALGRSVLAGALTLALVVLPIVILATQEALRAVPNSIRHASYALGATRWQTIWHQVLPAALPGIMTGVILAISRALGEAAPLVAIGAVAYVAHSPTSIWDRFALLPLQIFNWSARPQQEFHHVAGAAIIVLLVVLVGLNIAAVWVRIRSSQQTRW